MRTQSGLFTLLLLLASSGCKTQPDAPKPADVVTLGVITGLGGVTEPCGCTSNPLGGLDRMAARLEAGTGSVPFGYVVVGNTFYELDEPPAVRVEQEHQKAQAIAKIFDTMTAKPLAIVTGPRDLIVGSDRLKETLQGVKLPVFGRGRGHGLTRFRVDTVVRKIGGRSIGFVGVSGEKAMENPAMYSQGALTLRQQGAEFVVALVPEAGEQARKFVDVLAGMDVIVLGGQDEVAPPEIIGGSLVVEAGDRGQRLGLLSIHFKGEGAFAWFDGGKAECESLEKRTARLEGALERLEDGPAKEARAQKLAELQAELNAITVSTPKGRYVSWDIQNITKTQAADPAVTETLAVYNRSLCDLTLKSHEDRNCEGAKTPADTYVGTQTCVACHPGAYQVYQGTKHAHAWKTLQDKGKECDVGCIGCHSVGFEKAGGYCRLQDTKNFENVGCENCHGPGAGHAQNPGDKTTWSAQFVRNPPETTCVSCHNEEHSDQFNFETYRPRILGEGHGSPVAKQD